jgi:hypothetical protein
LNIKSHPDKSAVAFFYCLLLYASWTVLVRLHYYACA